MFEKLGLWRKDKFRISIIFNIVLFINLMVLIFINIKSSNKVYELSTVLEYFNEKKEAEIEELEFMVREKDAKINIDDEKIESWKNSYIELYNELLDQIEVNDALTEENLNLAKELESIIEYNQSIEERLVKYEYYNVFMWDGGNRTDCNFEIIGYLKDLIKDEPVNDITFYCAWIMVESKWHNDARSNLSNATGLPQFIGSTGKYVYEKLMGNEEGSYNHDVMATDPYIALPMMVTYVDKLLKANNGDLIKAIDNYRGKHSEEYLLKIDSYLTQCGTSLHEIVELTKKRFDAIYGIKG